LRRDDAVLFLNGVGRAAPFLQSIDESTSSPALNAVADALRAFE
jgi:hypothetical protein